MTDQLTPPPPPPAQPQVVDPRAAKAEAKAAKARSKALRPWYKKKRYLLLIGFGVLMVIAVATAGGEDEADTAGSGDAAPAPAGEEPRTTSNNETNPPPADIDDGWACTTDGIGFATATGTLTNHSSGTSSYMIQVVFEADGVRYADGHAFVNNVVPGATTEWEANGLTEHRAGTTCTLQEVDRFAS